MLLTPLEQASPISFEEQSSGSLRRGRANHRIRARKESRLDRRGQGNSLRLQHESKTFRWIWWILVHLAIREMIEIAFTLDRRDFGVLRLARGKKFRVIP